MKYDLGFLGGGQLARMSIQAAQRMGLRCLSLDPGTHTSAGQIADSLQGKLDDPEAIAQVLTLCERITLENEFIPASAIRDAFLRAGRDERALTPGIDTLATIQDKLLQREALSRAGVPSPNAAALIDPEGLRARLGDQPETEWRPVVMKARFGGYDGKGTRYGRTREEFATNLPTEDRSLAPPLPGGQGNAGNSLTPQPPLPEGEGGWLVEDFVPFRRELAVMVFIDERTKGVFPTMETVQANHVCDLVYPCSANGAEVAIAAVEAVGGRGLFGVELFELENGEILVNEIAPRPHNTGHYTLDWGGVSQFAQHVRLAMGWPVDPAPVGHPACMANLLAPAGLDDGDFDLRAALARAVEFQGVHAHWYGKGLRPGRKVGHLNVVGVSDLVETARAARVAFWG